MTRVRRLSYLVAILFLMTGCTGQMQGGLAGGDGADAQPDGARADTDFDAGDTPTADADAGTSGMGDVSEHDVADDITDDDASDSGGEPSVPVQVLVMYLDPGFEFATPVDIRLNGDWYRYEGRAASDSIWNSHLEQARGHILTLDEPLTHIEFDPDQLRVDGLNNHGFGHFNYLVQKRHPDTDLANLSADPNSPNYWASAYEDSSTHLARNGVDGTFAPDPGFYDLAVDEAWSDSGKVVIFVGGHGRHHPAFGPDDHPDADYYDDDTSPDEPPPPPEPAPWPGDIEIALTFLDGEFFDVTINGQTFAFAGRTASDPNWDYAFGNARGEVVTITDMFTSMELDPSQIRVAGLNNEGFGFISYKIVNKNPDADLSAINGVNDGNPEFWGSPADTDPLGVIVNRSGNTITGTQFPDPYFYLGLLDQSTHVRAFHSQWSQTEKIAISFMNYGQDHPDPALGFEGPWSP